jgi:hypothetical protein
MEPGDSYTPEVCGGQTQKSRLCCQGGCSAGKKLLRYTVSAWSCSLLRRRG